MCIVSQRRISIAIFSHFIFLFIITLRNAFLIQSIILHRVPHSIALHSYSKLYQLLDRHNLGTPSKRIHLKIHTMYLRHLYTKYQTSCFVLNCPLYLLYLIISTLSPILIYLPIAPSRLRSILTNKFQPRQRTCLQSALRSPFFAHSRINNN